MKIVLVTSGEEEDQGHFLSFNMDYELEPFYKEGVCPLIMPVLNWEDNYLDNILSKVDIVVLTGGDDIDPLFYEGNTSEDKKYYQVRDTMEISLVKRALEMKKPIFGICRGMEIINVALGGTLSEDIEKDIPGSLDHYYGDGKKRDLVLSHDVFIDKGTFLEDIFDTNKIMVNSFHNQSINKLGEGLIVSGRSSDGLIESIYHESLPVFGVIWHPELSYSFDENSKKLIRFICSL